MKSTLWWAGVAAFAILAGFLTYTGLRTTLDTGIAGGLGAPANATVVVPKSDIPLRRSIVNSDLTTMDVPVDIVPEGAARSVDEVVGMMSAVDLLAEKPILLQKLTTPDAVTRQLALSIPETKMVVSIPIHSPLIQTGLLRPGDFVDLAATFDIEVEREQASGKLKETVSLLRNFEVHALIIPAEFSLESESDKQAGVFETSEPGNQTILAALDREDGITLQHVIDTGGKLGVMLHVPGRETVTDTTAVDFFYLAERYNIPLQRGEPFVMSEQYFLDNLSEFVFTGQDIPKPDPNERKVGWTN